MLLSQVGGRMVLSVDTELSWLSQFHNITGPSHQIIGVPVYQDGANCGQYPGDGVTTLPAEKISFVGNILPDRTSYDQIRCPQE